MKLSKIKLNPNNPRIIKDDKFKKLVKSIKDFPEMMEKRPMVCVTDADGLIYPLGGNMRLKALIELKYKEIPDSWVVLADDWSEEQRKEFIIKDNVSFGEWDYDEFANNWDAGQLTEWGIDIPETLETLERINSNDAEFEAEINKYSDKNCQLPIVKEFFETHECFLIPIHNEIDEKFIREVFCLNENYISNCGDGKIRKTNVIDIQKIKSCLLK